MSILYRQVWPSFSNTVVTVKDSPSTMSNGKHNVHKQIIQISSTYSYAIMYQEEFDMISYGFVNFNIDILKNKKFSHRLTPYPSVRFPTHPVSIYVYIE